MTTRCTRCEAAVYGTVTPALDPRYGIGYCHTCRQRVTVRQEINPEAAEAECGCGAIGVPSHTNAQHYENTRPLEGGALRDAGMASAALNADQGVDAAWRSAATDVVRVLAASGQAFTINDVTDQVGLPSHRNATGSLLPTLARQGLIRKVGFAKGTRASQHARDVALWRGAWAVEAA